jgi:hypothetical protein
MQIINETPSRHFVVRRFISLSFPHRRLPSRRGFAVLSQRNAAQPPNWTVATTIVFKSMPPIDRHASMTSEASPTSGITGDDKPPGTVPGADDDLHPVADTGCPGQNDYRQREEATAWAAAKEGAIL